MLVPAVYERRDNPLDIPLEPVQAAQVKDQNAELVAGWCRGRVDRSGGGLLVFTPDSTVPARAGDYIVCRPVDGRFYPIKRTTFELAYRLKT